MDLACDYFLSIGYPVEMSHLEVKKAELKTIEVAIAKGRRPRVVIGSINYRKEDMEKYIEMGVKDFHLTSDVIIVYQWVKQNAELLRGLFKLCKKNLRVIKPTALF